MPHLFLPKLHQNANLSAPVANAVWEDKSRKIILSISDGIEVDENAQSRGVSSIPDIYARPLTFLSALKSDKHPLREKTIQEWRGLISLLALHKFNSNLDLISITPVRLGNDAFSKALKNLAPSKIKLAKDGTQYAWTDILLISFEDIPLGAFSPGTLLFTSADYHVKLKNRESFPVSLKDKDGFLKAPDVGDGIEFVGQWLAWFKREFNAIAFTADNEKSKDHEYAGMLNGHMDAWLAEIKGNIGIKSNESIHSEMIEIAKEPLEIPSSSFLPQYGIYQLLLRTLVRNKQFAGGHKSDYTLKPLRNRSDFSSVVIITASELAKDKILWEVTRPSQIDTDTVSLLSKMFKGASGTLIDNMNLETDKAIWIRPDLYFVSDFLLDAKNREILSEGERHLNGDNTRFILPFKKEILQFFSPEEVQELLKPRYEGNEADDRITFYFDLPLMDGTKVEVKKVYKRHSSNTGEGIIRQIDVPVVDIFPDYLGDFWSQYFIFASDAKTYGYTPINYRTDPDLRQDPVKKAISDGTATTNVIKVHGYDCFPEGIAIDLGGVPSGIVLLSRNMNSRPDMGPNGRPFRDSCTLGIDFGTSNTNVFMKVGNDIPRKVNFDFTTYKRKLFRSSPQESSKLSQLFFIPDTDVKLPIPTVLKAYQNGIHRELLLDYFIYFPDEPRYPENTYTGIKWEQTTDRTEAFLKSLMFILMVKIIHERYAEVTIKCTLPKSFSTDKQNAFEVCWNNLLEGMCYGEGTDRFERQLLYAPKDHLTVRNHTLTMETPNGLFVFNTLPHFHYEGIAAGEYFSRKDVSNPIADKTNGAVCIDVGGGTTDYSVWLKDNIVFDTSVRLSGNVLSQYLYNNARARSLLFSAEAVKSLNEAVSNSKIEHFESRLNYILKNEEDSILRQLGANANNEDIIGLRKMLVVHFSALAHYAAHICLVVNQQQNNVLSRNASLYGLYLHWGGNAAKLINWIDHGRFTENGLAAGFLNRAFYRALTDKELGSMAFGQLESLKQILSSGHKDEAAGGVVYCIQPNRKTSGGGFSGGGGPLGYSSESWDTGSASPFQNQHTTSAYERESWETDDTASVILGEDVLLSNDKVIMHYELTPVTALVTNDTVNYQRSQMTQLGKLLYFINGYGASIGLFAKGEIDLSRDDVREINQILLRNLYDQLKVEESKRELEPIFIYEIQELIRRMIAQYK